MSNHNFAAFVGLDWSDRQHAVCVSVGRQRTATQVLQKAEDIEAWACDLQKRFGGQPIAVCLEQSRGAILYALMKYEFLVLFPINPKQLASYRDALAPGGSKDDPIDAELLSMFVEQHHDRLRAWEPDDATTRALRLLAENRRRWVDKRTAAKNRLRQRLKEYFPLALELAGNHVASGWILKMLLKFPSHQELQRASSKTLTRLLPKRSRVTDEEGEDSRIKRIRASSPLIADAAIISVHRLEVRSLVQLIIQINQTVAEYDRQLDQVMAQHEDAALFQSFPASGVTMAPRLAAAFGTHRERFRSCQEVQQYSGVAPITKRSGKTCLVTRRLARPKFLHQTFHEYADYSRRKSKWADAFYRMKKSNGLGHHAALRSLAYKWQRIMYRCWTTRTPYDEDRYLNQLRVKNSPILNYLAPEINH